MDKKFQLELGERISKYRENAGLTQSELAERIGISQNHLSCLERGKYAIKAENLIRICEELGISVETLWYDRKASGSNLKIEKNLSWILSLNSEEQEKVNRLFETARDLIDSDTVNGNAGIEPERKRRAYRKKSKNK